MATGRPVSKDMSVIILSIRACALQSRAEAFTVVNVGSTRSTGTRGPTPTIPCQEDHRTGPVPTAAPPARRPVRLRSPRFCSEAATHVACRFSDNNCRHPFLISPGGAGSPESSGNQYNGSAWSPNMMILCGLCDGRGALHECFGTRHVPYMFPYWSIWGLSDFDPSRRFLTG